MEPSDKQAILDAFAQLTAHLAKGFDAVARHYDSLAGYLTSFRAETRKGFDDVENRLDSLEENVTAMSRSLDTIVEDNVLGKNTHIMLTRPEYDSLTEVAHLPNRFEPAPH